MLRDFNKSHRFMSENKIKRALGTGKRTASSKQGVKSKERLEELGPQPSSLEHRLSTKFSTMEVVVEFKDVEEMAGPRRLN